MKRAKAVVTVAVLTGLVVGLVCVVALSPPASAAAVRCDVSDQAIYTAPESISAAPGTVLACRSVTLTQVPGSISMRAWKVQYVSTDATGQKIAVTGTVAVPTAAWTGAGWRSTIADIPQATDRVAAAATSLFITSLF
jgi:triacylglycerol lipase